MYVWEVIEMKKVWETPEVLTVVHGSPEEAVLLTCYDSLTCKFEGVEGGEVLITETALS